MNKIIYCTLALMFAFAISKAQNPITWNMGMNLATSTFGNNHPRVTLDRKGNPLIIWWSQANRVMFSRWNSTSFTTPIMLNAMTMTVAGAAWMGPDIASFGDTVYVVFKQSPEASDTCHIYCVRSYNGGVSFFAPVRVDNINDSISRFPTITTDNMGNPIIAFMKFNAAFGESRWVVTKSNDFGASFTPDVKASGWSGAASEVCDCCPGAIVSEGSTVIMLYRDNKNNLRDSWAGFSTDNGNSFTNGLNIDQHNWNLNMCPSTGPDGVIVGDTLYSTFANGASGKSLVYLGKTSLSSMAGNQAMPLAATISGMTQQNFPRIATDGTALAVAWKQVVNSSDQLALQFTNNLSNGLPLNYEVVDMNDVTNVDVALTDGKIFVVWQDDNSGTIKYRQGSFSSATTIDEPNSVADFSLFPNPTNGKIHIESPSIMEEITVTNVLGQIVYQAQLNAKTVSLFLDKKGIYTVKIRSNGKVSSRNVSIWE